MHPRVNARPIECHQGSPSCPSGSLPATTVSNSAPPENGRRRTRIQDLSELGSLWFFISWLCDSSWIPGPSLYFSLFLLLVYLVNRYHVPGWLLYPLWSGFSDSQGSDSRTQTRDYTTQLWVNRNLEETCVHFSPELFPARACCPHLCASPCPFQSCSFNVDWLDGWTKETLNMIGYHVFSHPGHTQCTQGKNAILRNFLLRRKERMRRKNWSKGQCTQLHSSILMLVQKQIENHICYFWSSCDKTLSCLGLQTTLILNFLNA